MHILIVEALLDAIYLGNEQIHMDKRGCCRQLFGPHSPPIQPVAVVAVVVVPSSPPALSLHSTSVLACSLDLVAFLPLSCQASRKFSLGFRDCHPFYPVNYWRAFPSRRQHSYIAVLCLQISRKWDEETSQLN
jgi:hypothetical protein